MNTTSAYYHTHTRHHHHVQSRLGHPDVGYSTQGVKDSLEKQWNLFRTPGQSATTSLSNIPSGDRQAPKQLNPDQI